MTAKLSIISFRSRRSIFIVVESIPLVVLHLCLRIYMELYVLDVMHHVVWMSMYLQLTFLGVLMCWRSMQLCSNPMFDDECGPQVELMESWKFSTEEKHAISTGVL